jgi:putative ABC transport system ATP-binding protein
LADEPTGNLDSRTSLEIMALFQTLHSTGATLVLVTHEPDIAAFAQRQIHFRDGNILKDLRVDAPRRAADDLAAMGPAT